MKPMLIAGMMAVTAGVVLYGEKRAQKRQGLTSFKGKHDPFSKNKCQEGFNIAAALGDFFYFERPTGTCCQAYATPPPNPFQYTYVYHDYGDKGWQDVANYLRDTRDSTPNIRIGRVQGIDEATGKPVMQAKCIDSNKGIILGDPVAGPGCCGLDATHYRGA